MATPPKEGGTFSPDQIRQMTSAFDLAVDAASGQGTSFASMPDGELRRRLAGLIVAAARKGPVRADYLAGRALDGLRHMQHGIWAIEAR